MLLKLRNKNMYPERIKLQVLESQHPDYSRHLPALEDIDLLVSGGFKLKNTIRKFLPQRPGEEPEVYEARVNKYTYLNILGSAISDQVSRLSNSALVVSGVEDEKVAKFWEDFRENIDLAKKSEKSFISNIFREILKFKKVYLHVDKPKVDVEIQNKAQEEALGIRPYGVMYSALQVTNWSESKGKLQWIKVRQLLDDTSNPLEAPKKKIIWTYIDNTFVARYEAFVELDNYGNISKIGDEVVNDETTIPISRLVQHGLGTIPVLKVEVADDLWVADQAAAKALEHLRTDCSKYDLLTLAYFQRTYKRIQTPDGDLEDTYVDSDEQTIPTGLQYVLPLEKFEWNEPQGHILPHLMDSLRQIESQVKDLISIGGFSAELGAVTQSGVSKEMDFHKQDVVLKSYGEILTEAYQDFLQLVAKSAGLPYEDISVTGLSNFERSNLTTKLGSLDSIAKIDFNKLKGELPPTAFKLVYQQIVKELVGNVSAKQEQEIADEIEKLLLKSPEQIPTLSENIQ
ncbi:hypothetical protein ACQFX9_14355 [Aliinostoc sp. HNIBRCY26]|uniref:hypothetical protein n=1 Tax=Aliinostoc sp. HNIBRCY26 TaxID=3418997 RepID=UPI003D00359A